MATLLNGQEKNPLAVKTILVWRQDSYAGSTGLHERAACRGNNLGQVISNGCFGNCSANILNSYFFLVFRQICPYFTGKVHMMMQSLRVQPFCN